MPGNNGQINKQDFERRALSCAPKLHGIAYAMLRNEADCEDAVAEALFRAWQHLTRLREEKYFETWLIRILINACNAMLRKRSMNQTIQLAERVQEPPAQSPELQDALYALPIKYRLPLCMHYMQGYSVAEVAALLRLPQTTVKWRMHAARELLKKALSEGEDEK